MTPRLRSAPARLPPALALALALATSSGCARRDDACGDASTTAAELAPPSWTRIPSPSPSLAAPATPATPPAERPLARMEREPRPSWVPDASTLTVVEASDLRRNLGLLPEAISPDGGAAVSGGVSTTSAAVAQ